MQTPRVNLRCPTSVPEHESDLVCVDVIRPRRVPGRRTGGAAQVAADNVASSWSQKNAVFAGAHAGSVDLTLEEGHLARPGAGAGRRGVADAGAAHVRIEEGVTGAHSDQLAGLYAGAGRPAGGIRIGGQRQRWPAVLAVIQHASPGVAVAVEVEGAGEGSVFAGIEIGAPSAARAVGVAVVDRAEPAGRRRGTGLDGDQLPGRR